ncbi:hypothetical protein ASPSYDRAFT_49303 [Aspergillus sydowii CBS 593.65]|uniref:Uncharacterized protein n=1 Tax=Aspergillus sydowii CBS 593.65 TaxID=1036612 RepID=A0A1L9T6V2_9EURO|nr:uncharacterized protein ASPSYDRAFT_49303 [Aspergillus sydowii CBS 593.65]OJJ55138.1 hypothetical protein ASPSYDRAFT_49303 [Aspergillus sydowii CBS 593.65]
MRSEAFTARSWPSIRLPLAFAALGVREKVRASLLTEENKGKPNLPGWLAWSSRTSHWPWIFDKLAAFAKYRNY